PPAAARRSVSRDVLAGLTVAAAQVGNAMAYTLLAGVPPVHGLYATMVGTPVAALTAGSQRMAVVPTAALCLAAGGALATLPAEQRIAGLFVLTLLAGLLMLVAGLLRAGGLIRFISRATMVGFMAGVAVQIILSQLTVVTGFTSTHSNRAAQTGDLLLHLDAVDLPTLLVGVAAVALVLLLSRTPFRLLAIATALVVLTVAVALLDLPSVAVVEDIAQIPDGLPLPQLPDLSLAPRLLLPALALAIIALVQGAGISWTVPNADGGWGDTSRDFVGQGAANVAGSFFGGGPMGGSVQATALNVRAGARSRWSLVVAGAAVAAVVVGAAPLVAQVPLAVTGGILLVAAASAIDLRAVRDIWRADRLSAGVMVITFVLVLLIPLQYAVLAGAAISVLKYIYLASLDVRVVEIEVSDGRLHERSCPLALRDDSVTVLDIYGSLFYAAGPKLRASLPAAGAARRAVVVLRLRGRGTLQSATIALIRNYAAELAAGGGRLYLSGVGPEMMGQLRRTGLLRTLGEDAVAPATDEPYGSCEAARVRAEAWLAGQTGGGAAGRREDGAAEPRGEATVKQGGSEGTAARSEDAAARDPAAG
ncbi:MAG: SulP family inorganic anion transporter, partial [Thermoleophilia bacterium]|nr:SulP family inorganic anion transporter [Thermoleophilia bacterium]